MKIMVIVFLESNLEAQEVPANVEQNCLERNSEGRMRSHNVKGKEFCR